MLDLIKNFICSFFFYNSYSLCDSEHIMLPSFLSLEPVCVCVLLMGSRASLNRYFRASYVTGPTVLQSLTTDVSQLTQNGPYDLIRCPQWWKKPWERTQAEKCSAWVKVKKTSCMFLEVIMEHVLIYVECVGVSIII